MLFGFAGYGFRLGAFGLHRENVLAALGDVSSLANLSEAFNHAP